MEEHIYAEYGKILLSYTKLPLAIIIASIIVLFIFIIVLLKFKEFDIFSIVFCAVFSIVIFCGFYSHVYLYNEDVKHNDYVVYTGKFYVVDYYFASRSGWFVEIKNSDSDSIEKYNAYGNIPVEADTWYDGTYIIGKRSKALVELTITEGQNNNTGDDSMCSKNT